ncbi:MAG TPA: Mov34/MPN/PAD-1 family protein, partial [Saprospiraceae bacterium]|nr:Mov34/MPN/PAD-1 family protein [Saprospiraceae bacterium]
SKFSGEMVYVGDWHSHPNGTNQYSQDDYHSIKSVAISSNVNTHNPILMIAAFGKDYFSPGFYVFHDDKLLMYELVQ